MGSPNSSEALYESVTVIIMFINIFFCFYFFKAAFAVAREEISWCQSKEQKAKRKREAEERKDELARLTFERETRRSKMSQGNGELDFSVDDIGLDVKSNPLIKEKSNEKVKKKSKEKRGSKKEKRKKKKTGRASAIINIDVNQGVEMVETKSSPKTRRESLNPLNVLAEVTAEVDPKIYLDEVS